MPAALVDILARGGDEAEYRYYIGTPPDHASGGVSRAKSSYMKLIDNIVKEIKGGI